MEPNEKPPVLDYAPGVPRDAGRLRAWAFLLGGITLLGMLVAGVGGDSTTFPLLKKALFSAVTLLAITLLSLANKRLGCGFILAMVLLAEMLVMWFWN